MSANYILLGQFQLNLLKYLILIMEEEKRKTRVHKLNAKQT